ncbi:MAG: hypothetical protein HRF49_05740 [bacterium]|jgi:hypothetical protein
MLLAAAVPLAGASTEDEGSSNDSFPVLTYGGSNKTQYTRDKISDTRKTENEFALNLGYGDFDGYFRISNDLAFPNTEKSTEFEKATIRWHGRNVTLTAGDFSALFSNGLALNVFEAPDIDYDTELEGLKADVEIGDALLTVLHGEWKSDSIKKPDTVQAAHLEIPISDNVSIGGSYVEVDDYVSEFVGTKEHTETGANASVSVGPFEFSGEFVIFDRKEDESTFDGSGWIVAGTYYGKNWSVHGGYYDYDEIATVYAVPATFKEHPEHGGVSAADEVGYGAKVTWSPPDLGQIDINYAQSNEDGGGFPYTEAITTWTLPSMKRDNIQIQSRYDFWLDTKQNATLVEWQHTIDEDWTSTVSGEITWVDDFSGTRQEHLLALGADYQQMLSINYMYELAQFKFPTQNEWNNVTVRYSDPGYRYDVQFKVGSQRAGYNCSGGICQLLPEFKGFELTVNLYF